MFFCQDLGSRLHASTTPSTDMKMLLVLSGAALVGLSQAAAIVAPRQIQIPYVRFFGGGLTILADNGLDSK
jgi:hypothetical protein